MTENYELTSKQMDRLEDFAANYEQLRNLIDLLNWHIWEGITTNDTASGIKRAATLSSALVELAHNRDAELESLIQGIGKKGATNE